MVIGSFQKKYTKNSNKLFQPRLTINVENMRNIYQTDLEKLGPLIPNSSSGNTSRGHIFGPQ